MKKDDDETKNLQYEQIVLESKHETAHSDQEFTAQKKSTKQRRKRTGRLLEILKVAFSWKTFRMFLSHHPYCDEYEHHVFKIGKVRLCRGCTLSYPPAYFLPILWLSWFRARDFFRFEGFLIPNIWWFTIAFSIFGVLTYFIKKYSIYINDIYKITRGALLGFFFIIMLQEAWYYKLIFGVLIFGLMSYLSFKRGKDMEKTCNDCEWEGNFQACPGFKDLYSNFQPLQQKSSINDDKLQPVKTSIDTKNNQTENNEN